MQFEIISEIENVEIIASGSGIRILPILRKRYGVGRWRKLKGIATVRLSNGDVRLRECFLSPNHRSFVHGFRGTHGKRQLFKALFRENQ